MFYKGLFLLIIYILGGIFLEKGLGLTSPPLFSFYGYVMAIITSAVAAHHYAK